MKKVLDTYSSPRPHWVGDGFPVRSLFSYDTLGQQASPYQQEVAREAQMVLLDRAGNDLLAEANSDATLLLLSDEAIDEPIIGHRPFVMNTQGEILQAMQDFNAGRFGQMPH